MRRSWSILLFISMAIGVAVPVAHAAYPDKPITMVVPYPPNGAADILGRITARHLAAAIPSASVIVENKAGAGTVLGAAAVAQSAPDGYTLLVSGNTTYTLNPALRAQLPYDPAKSFESIGGIGATPLVLVTTASSPHKTARELIVQAKAQPGKLSYASFGTGTTSHFAGELFKYAAGIDVTHVPYKGSAPAMTDLIGGHVPLSFDTTIASVPQIRGGKIRALAVTSAKRIAALPEVPTVAELGFPDYELTAWLAVVAPRGLAAPARATLVNALANAMKKPEMRAELSKVGLEVQYEPPAAYDARVAKELPAMRALVRRAGIKVD